MAITTLSTGGSYAGNGTTTAFATPFPFFNAADIVVTLTPVGGQPGSPLTLGVDYTVTGGLDAFGTVTMTVAPSSSTVVTITRSTAPTQPTSFQSQGSFSPKTHEQAFDRATMVTQELSIQTQELTGITSNLDGRVSALETSGVGGGSVTVPLLLGIGATASSLGGTLTAILANQGNYVITLNENLVVANPTVTGFGVGTKLTYHFIQDATGGRLVAFGTNFNNGTRFQARQGPLQRSAVTWALAGDGTWGITELDGIDTFQAIHTRDFGADPTGVADSHAAIQACVDYATYTLKSKAILDHGIYSTSDTLQMGYGTGFARAVLEGEGYVYGGSSAFAGSALVPTFSDRPCVNFQGGRGSVLRGVALIGKLANWIQTHNFGLLGTPTLDDTVHTNWNDPGLAATQDGQHCPYAAVSVDAYAGTQPTDHYPAVTYPGFLGSVSQYGKDFSSDCSIEDCYISGFDVGVANQPCDADGNGDFTCLRRVNMECCKYGISIGNTQSRNVGIDDVKFSQMYAFMVNGKHGRQQGHFGGTVKNLSGGASIKIFDFTSSAQTGPITFLNMYVEAQFRIGDVGTPTSVETGMHFINCQFDFGLQDPVHRGVSADILGPLGGSANLDMVFEGCTFIDLYSVAVFSIAGAQFKKCNMTCTARPQSSSLPTYQALAHNFLMGGFVLPNLPCDQHEIYSTSIDLDTGTWNINNLTKPSYVNGTRTYCIPMFAPSVMAQSGFRESLQVPTNGQPLDKSGLTSTSVTGRELQFTIALNNWQGNYFGLYPGDVLWDETTGTIFFIHSTTGTTSLTIHATAQNNFKTVSGVDSLLTAITFSGVMYCGLSRLYTPTYPLLVDTTASSATLANAARDDGYGGFMSTDLAVGDAVYIDQYANNWTAASSAQISAINTGAPSLTLAGGASRTLSRHRIPFFIRAPPANV